MTNGDDIPPTSTSMQTVLRRLVGEVLGEAHTEVAQEADGRTALILSFTNTDVTCPLIEALAKGKQADERIALDQEAISWSATVFTRRRGQARLLRRLVIGVDLLANAARVRFVFRYPLKRPVEDKLRYLLAALGHPRECPAPVR